MVSPIISFRLVVRYQAATSLLHLRIAKTARRLQLGETKEEEEQVQDPLQEEEEVVVVVVEEEAPS